MAMLTLGDPVVEEFRRIGFVVLKEVIAHDLVSDLRAEVAALADAESRRGVVRNGLERSRVFREVALREVGAVAERFLGDAARPGRLTVFDKTPKANWKVPMHEDLTITVADRRDVAGFGPWSSKDGAEW